MSPFASMLRMLPMLALAAMLAGCVTAPPIPLMSPLDAGGGFGYSERRIADDRFEVTYLGPRTRTTIRSADRQADSERARNLAYDLALWRAAEVSALKGYPAFLVEDKRTDIEIEIIEDASYIHHFDAFHRHGLHGSRFFHIPTYGRGYRRVRLQASATLTVALLRQPTSGAFDATATAESLRRKHPNALEVPLN